MNLKALSATVAIYSASIAALILSSGSWIEESMHDGNKHLAKSTSIQDSQVIVNPTAREELELAIRDFNKVLLLSRNNSQALFNRGNANFKLGNFDKAIEDYSACLEQDPTNWHALLLRASAYENISQLELAYRDYNSSVTLARSDSSPSSIVVASQSYNNFLRKLHLSQAR